MKSFLSKVGKLDKILKHEGLINGGTRIVKTGWQYLKMLQGLGKGDILFIAGGALGDSTLYRVHHQKEELEIHGFKCAVAAQDSPWLLGSVKNFKVFIFHRVLSTTGTRKAIKNMIKNNKEIILDTDDLLFDLKYVKETEFFQKMNWLERKNFGNGVGGEILKNPYVKVCVTTTAYLADKLREYDKKVFISKNKLSNYDLKIADVILSKRKRHEKSRDNEVRLGYFSGTPSHNKDFATITDALMRIMVKYPRTVLILVGPLNVGNILNKFKERITQIPRVSREKYFENIVQVDINLAPLELDDPFCESKSELKFFDVGIVGVPTVAVRNRTFSGAIIDGMDGFLAADKNEWVEKLSRLIENKNLRAEMGKRAREKALAEYSNQNSHNEEYYNYLKSKL